MAKEIVLAKFEFDIQDVLKTMATLEKQIGELEKKQDKLTLKGKESSSQYANNRSTIDGLTTAHKTLNSLITSQTAAVAAQGKTFNDYKQQIIDAAQSISIFNGGLSGLISRAQQAGGAGPLVINAFKGMKDGIAGMTTAAQAFLKNPFGIALMAINLIVQGLVAVYKDFTPLVNKVEQVMAAVGAVFESVKNSVLGLLTGATSLGDFFTGFAGDAANAADGAMKLTKAQQELTLAMQAQEIANETAKKSIEEYKAAVADQTLTDEDRIKALEKLQETENNNIGRQIENADEAYNIAVGKIANGKNLTAEEMKNLETLGVSYAQELAEKKLISADEIEMLKTAQIERTRVYGEEEAMCRTHINTQKSLEDELNTKREQHAEAELARRQKLIDDALDKQKQMLALYAAQNNAHSNTLAESIKYEEGYAKKSLGILQNELKNKKISLLEYKSEALSITTQQAENIAQAAAQFGKAELDLWLEKNRSIIQSGEQVTAEIAEQERTRLETKFKMEQEQLEKEKGVKAAAIALKQANNQALLLEEINYLTEVARLKREHDGAMAATAQAEAAAAKQKEEDEKAGLQKTREEEATARAIDYEVKIAQADSWQEAEKLKEEQRYANEVAELKKRKDGLISHTQYNDLLSAADKEHTDNKKALDKAVMDNKLNLAASTFGSMAAILGKESAAGKAMAVAQATIDTYKSAVSAYSAMSGIPVVGPVLGAVAAAAAVAAGIANVKKITSTKAPKAEKGALFSIGGNRHSNGGTMFRGADGTAFEAEQGELIGVMNRNAARHFMAFNNAFPAGGASAPNYFAGGGIVSREMAPASLNIDELAAKIAMANRAIPAPVVAVQDIITQGNSYVQVRDAANF